MTNPRTARRIIEGSTETVVHDFPYRDKKGRTIGCRVVTRLDEFYIDSEKSTGFWGMEPGTYFYADVMATRDGERYGASQRSRYFETVAERDTFIAKRIEDSRKRAAKIDH